MILPVVDTQLLLLHREKMAEGSSDPRPYSWVPASSFSFEAVARLQRVTFITTFPGISDHHFILELQPINCKREAEMAPASQSYEVEHVPCRRVRLTHHSDCGITEVTVMIAKATVIKSVSCHSPGSCLLIFLIISG